MSAQSAGGLQRAGLLVFCVVGIYTAYLTQGIVSEHLAVKRYGPQQERFGYLDALNGAQALACFAWAWIIVQVMERAGSIQPAKVPPWTAYWKAGITNSVGPALGMVALKNITYSAQVLVKSCKMVPVMLMGTLLYRKRYSPAEYVCMLLVGVGVALFGKRSSHGVASKLANPNTGLGYALCLANLALDGYTNAAQDEINRHYPTSPPMHMMCWMNFWTAFYYAVYLFGFSGSGLGLLQFCTVHPDAAWDVALFCACGLFGQLFIFLTIKQFGSLVNTLVCTTRKFFNILISVVFNGNPLLPSQWVAVYMVFSGLIASTLLKRKHGSHRAHGAVGSKAAAVHDSAGGEKAANGKSKAQ